MLYLLLSARVISALRLWRQPYRHRRRCGRRHQGLPRPQGDEGQTLESLGDDDAIAGSDRRRGTSYGGNTDYADKFGNMRQKIRQGDERQIMEGSQAGYDRRLHAAERAVFERASDEQVVNLCFSESSTEVRR